MLMFGSNFVSVHGEVVSQVIQFTLLVLGGQAATLATTEAVKQPNLFIPLQRHQQGGIPVQLTCSVVLSE
jgi:hypothetical protein